MGSGYIYHCNNFNKSYNAFLGIGMGFREVYHEITKNISARL